MANELTITASMRLSKSNVVLPQRSLSGAFDVSGVPVLHLAASIGTDEETLEKGELTLTGYAYFYNCDATNFVEIGNATGTYQIKLKAGEFALLRLDNWSNIYAKADTGAVTLEYALISN